MLTILNAPHKVLTTIAKPVDKIDQDVMDLVHKMEKTLIAQKDPEGVGLAAPQVGISLRLFIMRLKKGDPVEVVINPTYAHTPPSHTKKKSTEGKKNEQPKMEGCLSVSRIWAPLKRQPVVTIEYTTLDGTRKTETFRGLKSTIVQHELDHLDGVLFTQRCIEQNVQLYEEIRGKLHKITI